MAECPSCHAKIMSPVKVYSPAIGRGGMSFPLNELIVCDKCGLKLIVTTKSRVIFKLTYFAILFFILSFLLLFGHFLKIHYLIDSSRIYIVGLFLMMLCFAVATITLPEILWRHLINLREVKSNGEK